MLKFRFDRRISLSSFLLMLAMNTFIDLMLPSSSWIFACFELGLIGVLVRELFSDFAERLVVAAIPDTSDQLVRQMYGSKKGLLAVYKGDRSGPFYTETFCSFSSCFGAAVTVARLEVKSLRAWACGLCPGFMSDIFVSTFVA